MTIIPFICADDHPIVRQGMQMILERNPSLQCIGQASDGEHAMQLIRLHKPVIAILDMDMPKMNGLDVARAIQKEHIDTAVIIMTAHKDGMVMREAMKNGVRGFVVKENAVTEVLTCVDTVLNGGRYVSPVMTEYFLSQSNADDAARTTEEGMTSLTLTERKVLRLVAKNKPSREIAEELFISHRTVENHRNNICKKLNISGSNALLRFALENKDMI
ncbi:MAG: response regulator transcription factor [Bacteroidota bacterium]